MMTDSRGTGLQQWTKKITAKFSEHISDFEAEDKKNCFNIILQPMTSFIMFYLGKISI